MNQPASKEPTMDEILSSIRQIIADDDEAATQKMPSVKAAAAKPAALKSAPAPAAAQEPVPAPPPSFADIDPFSDDDEDEVPPLALSPEQIVAEAPESEPEAPEMDMPSAASLEAAAELVVPDDIEFAQEDLMAAQAAESAPEPIGAAAPASEPMAAFAPEPAAAQPRQAEAAPAARPSFAQAAPMPDPALSSDLAAELLEPATSEAVRSAFSKLSTPRLTPEMALGASGLTIEAMIREMLRPMLKEWLDENLPSMVERIVEAEIERVSRGG